MSIVIFRLIKNYGKRFWNIKHEKSSNNDMVDWLYKNSTYHNSGVPCIYVVLTRSKSIAAKAVEFYKHDEYTHAAISLDKDLKTLYSFGRKWVRFPFVGCFRNEVLDEGFYATHETLPGIILKIDTTKEQYHMVLQTITHFIKNKDMYRYNFLGFFGNALGVGIKNNNRFTCSEFVAYVLQQCGIVNFNTSLNLVRPQLLADISAQVIFKGDLKQYYASLQNAKSA